MSYPSTIDAPSPSSNGEQSPKSNTSRLGSLTLSDREQRVRRKSGFKRFLQVVVVLGLLAAGGFYYADSQGMISLREQMQTPTCAGYVVSRGIAETVLSLSGVIQPHKTIDVTPLVPGPIVELPVSEGDYVNKGDLLARILDTNYLADMHSAEAALAIARSRLLELENGTLPEEIDIIRAQIDAAKGELESKTSNYERSRKLVQSRTINEADYELAEASLVSAKATLDRLNAELKLAVDGPRQELIESARGEVKQAEAALEKARFYTEHTRVEAPISGTIIERNAELGEVSRSDYFLTDLCKIGDMSEMEVFVEVQERQLQRVFIDQPCRVIPDAYPTTRYDAVVSRIQPRVNRQRGVVGIVVKLKNPDERLLSEMNARVEFLDIAVMNSEDRVLPVPKDLVAFNPEDPVQEQQIFVAANGLVEQRTIETIGHSDTEEFVLVRGELEGGETILIPNSDSHLVVGEPVIVEATNYVESE